MLILPQSQDPQAFFLGLRTAMAFHLRVARPDFAFVTSDEADVFIVEFVLWWMTRYLIT